MAQFAQNRNVFDWKMHQNACQYVPMAQDDTRVGPASLVLAANIARVREAKRLSYIDLSRELSRAGRPIPELGLRRIEKGERRIDFDDLIAIAYVLRVCPVDLMISGDVADSDPYPVTATRLYESGSVRDWIGGQTVLLESYQEPGARFAKPDRSMFDALQWMPKARRAHVLRNVLHAEEEEL
jgi:transcriptional regulator with XRE-family HTH domain